MLIKVTLPEGGQNTDQLRVTAWRKQVGEPVKRGDILLEVETDKAVLEIESFAEGTLLARMIEEGSYGTAGDVIAYIGNPEDGIALQNLTANPDNTTSKSDDIAPARPATAAETSHAAAQNGSVAEPTRGQLKATPAAKKSARELHLNLSEVQRRTGKEILRRADITAFAGQQAAHPPSTAATLDGDPMAGQLFPLTPMRQAIAARMQLSRSTIPAFSAEIEADMSACIRLRSELNQFAHGFKVSYHDIIAKCIALAAGDYPLINASCTGDGIRVFRSVNIGLAVSLDQGLAVPVVQDVRTKSLAEVAQEYAVHIAQVRSGKFDPKLLENGTLTLSNLGQYAISRFTAIINPPQACIIAIGRIHSRPHWEDGQWRELPTACLTGSFDHRIVDGVYGAAFLTRLKELLEHPKLLLL